MITIHRGLLFVTAQAQTLSRCDGDVRVLLQDNYWEPKLVFKPNTFIADSSFTLRFRDKVPCNTCYFDITCPINDTNTCIVDAKKELYYVTVRDFKHKRRPTNVLFYGYADNCKWSTQRQFNTNSTHLIPVSRFFKCFFKSLHLHNEFVNRKQK